jgi:Methylamine utilization protein MauJ
MARLEVVVNSPLAFSRRFADAIDERELGDVFSRAPDTVGIEFRGRLFVWHAFPSLERPGPGHEESCPTVTVLVDDETDARDAADELQRFVSALAFNYQEPAETRYAQRTDVTDAFAPAMNRGPRSTLWGWTLAPPPARIVMLPEQNVQLAVAYYREGLNSGSPFYGFLAFWNALDATFAVPGRGAKRRGSPRAARDAFIREFAPNARKLWPTGLPFPSDLADALERDSRNAIAHVIRGANERSVDPDVAEDRTRLRVEMDVLKWMAHEAVERQYPGAVRVEL